MVNTLPMGCLIGAGWRTMVETEKQVGPQLNLVLDAPVGRQQPFLRLALQFVREALSTHRNAPRSARCHRQHLETARIRGHGPVPPCEAMDTSSFLHDRRPGLRRKVKRVHHQRTDPRTTNIVGIDAAHYASRCIGKKRGQ